MAGEATRRKISPASARSHTRKRPQSSSLPSPISLSCVYQATGPPPPRICGSIDGPPIAATRIVLTDGRNLAYKEHDVQRDIAKFKIVYLHGFDACRHDAIVANNLSPVLSDLLKKWGYTLSGESDPNPIGSVKALALDVEELADQLKLGPKFYIIGFSLGGEMACGCLKYILTLADPSH